MPTTTVKTIGTGGDYTTLQAWEDACPANLVSADEIWRGEVLNETLLQSLTISGQTTDATRYVELTAQAGASFMDHADRATRALRFDPSYGATIRNDAPYGTVLNISTAYTRINRLLIGDNTTGPTRALDMGSSTGSRLENCIIKTSQTVSLGGGGSAIAANVFIHSTGGNLFWINSGSSILNCTFVRPSNLGNTTWGTVNNYTSVTIKNTAVFGASNFASVSFTGNNNASNASIGSGTSNQASLTYADQFEEASAASGTEDFRPKAGSALIDTGADLSGSGITDDIIGTARGATYDIGAWEIAASGATYNDTISDATTAADATASALTIAGAIIDPATAADASAAAHVAVSSITDAATAGEATAAALVGLASVTDAATGGDATAAALVAAASASDATTAADTTASAWTGAASVSDAATATDAAAGALGAVTYNETISDSATAADSLGAALAVTATISDGLNTLDALAALLAASDIVVDAVAASDGLAAAWTAMASVSDTLAVGDLARIGAEFLAATPERTVTWPYAARAATWIAESRAVAWPATSRTVTWRQ